MSILINEKTKVLVQGITGATARFHTKEMLDYGTNIVAGVTPHKAGDDVYGVPVFNTVKEAVLQTKATVSIIYVPAKFAYDAILEGIDAELDLIICITEHIPVHDMIRIKNYLIGKKTQLIGPNCPGIITPGASKIGIMPAYIHKPGHIGVVSRSGTLTYEAVQQLSDAGLGQSTAVGIGGDPIQGSDFIKILHAFNEDEHTLAVMMIGEIGGNNEEKAASWIKEHMKKPVVAFISGESAPEGKTMGHAGAIISSGIGTAHSKIEALEKANVAIAKTPSTMAETLIKELQKNNLLDKCIKQ